MDAVQAVPQELVPNHDGEQIGVVPVPQIKEDISERTQIVGMPLLQTMGTSPKNASWSVRRSSTCQCRGLRETFPRSASRIVHRSPMCQCPRFLGPFTRSASRSAYTNRPSINQVTKHAEIPQTLHIDKVVGMPVVMQRQVPRIQTCLLEQPVGHAVVEAILRLGEKLPSVMASRKTGLALPAVTK